MKKLLLIALSFGISQIAFSQTIDKKVIETKNAPAPIGPYSQAIQTGNLLFLSGQIAKDPATGAMKNANITEETIQVMNNIKAILESAGLTLDNIVKTTIYLTDINDYKQVNDIYGSYFIRTDAKANHPARETVQVAALPAGAKIEISVVAVVK